MVCPYCGFKKIHTHNSRKTKRNNQVWRRRLCESCRRSFTTREYIDISDIIVTTRSGVESPYSRAKLLSSIIAACDHLEDDKIEKAYALSETIETKLQGNEKLSTQEIVNATIDVLEKYNEFAVMKYRSYYEK